MNSLHTKKINFAADITEWRNCVISKEFPTNITNGNTQVDSSTDLELLDNVFSTIVDFKITDMNRYVYAKSVILDKVNSEMLGPIPEEEDISEETYKRNVIFKEEHLLDLPSAQEFLSYLVSFTSDGYSEIVNILPLLVFCNGQSNKKKIYMFHVQAQPEEGTLFSANKQPNFPSFSLLMRAVACDGPLSSSVWLKEGLKEESSHQCPRESMCSCKAFASKLAIQPHMLNASGTFTSDTSLVISTFSQYHLFGESHSLMKSITDDSEIANITVDIESKQASDILCVDPRHITAVTANISPIPGDIRSPAFSLFKDVLILKGLLKAFGPSKQVKWAEREDTDYDEEKLGVASMLKKVSSVMESFRKQYISQSGVSETKETDEDDVINLLQPRKELDFTDKMWDVLKYAESYQELSDALTVVMKEISEGTSSRFWLHEGNDTLLADLVKESYQGIASLPALTGLLPLQILMEIGLEKLRRDYINFFFTHHFSTALRLARLTEVTKGDCPATVLTKKLNGILKLHHVTELATYCHSFLQLPLRKIDKIVRSALLEYSSCDADFSKVFTFPVLYNEVKSFLESLSPTLWKMKAVAHNENGKSTGVACWSTNFPFAGLMPSSEDSVDTELSEEEEKNQSQDYFVTTVTESLLVTV